MAAKKKLQPIPYDRCSTQAKKLADKLRKDVNSLTSVDDKTKQVALKAVDLLEETLFRIPKNNKKISTNPTVDTLSLLDEKAKSPVVFSWSFKETSKSGEYTMGGLGEWIFPHPSKGKPSFKFKIEGSVRPDSSFSDLLDFIASHEASLDAMNNIAMLKPGVLHEKYVMKSWEAQVERAKKAAKKSGVAKMTPAV